MHAKIIADVNQKGGVGKTTSTINLGAALTKLGKKVLLVDSDPQGHLSVGLGYPKKLKDTLKTMMEYIIMGMDFDPQEILLHHQEGFDLIPSNKLLAGIDMSLVTVPDGEKVLRELLDMLKEQYDFILIDCMPSLGMLTVNALTAADSVIIPVQPQYYSADGLMELLMVVNDIRKRYNPKLEVEGILYTLDNRSNNARNVKNAIAEAYGNNMHIFDTTIPRLEPIAETSGSGGSTFAFTKALRGAEAYLTIAQEVLKHAESK